MSWLYKTERWAFLGLFGSVGTLICCVLPVTLVLLGFGSVMASLVSNVPGLVWISEHKELAFGLAAVLVGFSGLTIYLNRNQPCPIDPDLRRACLTGRRVALILFLISLALFVLGSVVTFVVPRFMDAFG